MPRPTAPTKVDFIISRGGSQLIDLTFRNAVPGDTGRMHELSQPYTASGRLIDRTPALFENQVEDFFVTEVDGEIVACAGLRRFGDIAEIFNVVVAANWQSFGIGRLLLGSMMAVIAEQGFSRALVFSKGASDWFERFGFEPVAPASLPTERTAIIDPARDSTPMMRDVVAAGNGLEALSLLTDVQVRFDRSDVDVAWDGESDALLPFAEKHDIEIDSLCWGGVCGTCGTPLKSGTVSYHMRPEIQPEAGEVLLCITRPLTGLVMEL